MKRLLLLLCILAAAGCSSDPSHDDIAAISGTDRDGSGQVDRADESTGSPEPAAAEGRCSMGFRELFMLAKGREWTAAEVQAFAALDQEGKNRAVKQLAAEAGGIRTQDQVGTDGVVYTAFWKE